jgi:hypothetical protein
VDPSAARVVSEVTQRYGSLARYKDSGTAIVRTLGSRLAIDGIAFQTAFLRSGPFRFEYRREFGDRSEQHVIEGTAAEATVRWNARTLPDCTSTLKAAVVKATGISLGAARVIPSLLIPDTLGGRSPFELDDLRILDESQLDGVQCIRIGGWAARKRALYGLGDGPQMSGRPFRSLLIEQESWLVRRVTSTTVFDGEEVETKLDYQPDDMTAVSPADFKWRP